MRSRAPQRNAANGAWNRFTGIWRGAAYGQFLRRRGFTASEGWLFVRRAFLDCWVQPGFHRFWRIWNPALGYLTFLLYRRLSGNRGRPATGIIVFVTSGLAHSLIVLPVLGWSFTIPVTFTCFGVLVAASQGLSHRLRQERWPAALNLLVNVGLVVVSFEAGFRANALLACGPCHR